MQPGYSRCSFDLYRRREKVRHASVESKAGFEFYAPSFSTGKAPYELFMRYTPKPTHSWRTKMHLNLCSMRIWEIRQGVKRKLDAEQAKQKHKDDKHRRAGSTFVKGDGVFIRTCSGSDQGRSCCKLFLEYNGPFVITK